MKKFLVGYTGFVGSNLCSEEIFDGLYNSKNIQESYKKEPDILVYSGVPAQKFIANKFPEQDFKIIQDAIENIKKINPRKVVLISTIDIYKEPVNVDEDTEIILDNLQAYGKNRYYLERWVKENFDEYLIVHLPGLYGKNIKKNFIYDLINIIPSMLNEEKYKDVLSKCSSIKDYYTKQDNGFYHVRELNNEERQQLKQFFSGFEFNALNFTDSRGIYQFYNLKYLWQHIEIAIKNKIKVLNLAAEPVSISEIYKYIKESKFVNEISKDIPYYNFKTKYDYLYDGKNGYIFDKDFILEDIKKFVEEMNK